MPKRVSTLTYSSDDVQGEGSWVKVRAQTIGEMLENQRQGEDRDNIRYKLGALVGRVFRRRPPQSVLTYQFLRRSIQYVRAWNWVDDSGEPLPYPADDPRVLERLTSAEMTFIVECIQGERQSEERKN